jgi:endoglucanase
MFRRLSLFLTLLVFLVSCVSAPDQPAPRPVPVKSTETPSRPPTPTLTSDPFPEAFAAARALGRGVNLGNALEAPSEGAWGVTLREEYFELIHQAGFNAVRLPIRWDAHAAENAPYTIDPVFFARVDRVLNWALRRDLAVIVDFHNYPKLMADPQGQRERYLALWEQIAGHYRDYPTAVVFELLNEPNDRFDAAAWNEIGSAALQVVRQSNPNRNVVLGGAGWNAYDQLQYLQLPENDRHLIATFHYYNPFEFTHQGAEWADGMDKYLGTRWDATEAEKALITGQFEQVAAWAAAHHRPVLLGEFGAYSKAGMDSRARWTAFVARAAEKQGFAWAYWEFCAGFGVYDPAAKVWREPLLKALIP